MIFLIATFCCEGLWIAELGIIIISHEVGLVRTDDLPDNTISTFAYNILNIILIRDIERDLARPSVRRSWLDHTDCVKGLTAGCRNSSFFNSGSCDSWGVELLSCLSNFLATILLFNFAMSVLKFVLKHLVLEFQLLVGWS